jgi:hypothetical protein
VAAGIFRFMKGRRASIAVTLAVAVLVGSGVGACGTRSNASDTPGAPTGVTLTKMENTAWSMASLNGGGVPKTADVVLSNRQSSENTVGGGDQVDSNQRIYVVQMSGRFVAYMASTPPGIKAPTGGALAFNFDPATEQVTDWGVTAKPYDLSALGQVFQIVPTPASTPSPTSQ